MFPVTTRKLICCLIEVVVRKFFVGMRNIDFFKAFFLSVRRKHRLVEFFAVKPIEIEIDFSHKILLFFRLYYHTILLGNFQDLIMRFYCQSKVIKPKKTFGICFVN